MTILVDTREQLPIWTGKNTERVKLDEGDYTTPELKELAHIERKSGIDLYGSIIQGHERFRDEIKRANNKGLKLAVFVECTKEDFIGKKFKGGFRLKTHPGVLRKIIKTMEQKYDLQFVWCTDRNDFKSKATAWFEKQREDLNVRI